MFFGFNDSLKTWKKDLKASGADMSLVREWQKSFDKVKRQTPQMEHQYTQVKNDLERIFAILEQMEQLLIECKENQISLEEVKVNQQFMNFSNELKKYKNVFNHEFLISEHDTEFHLTYDTLLRLCEKRDKDALILQSEVENLIALSKEALEKEWPGFRAMAFFYIERSDKEIFDLPHSDKVEKVNRIYENEFFKPIRQILENCYGKEKARQILEVELWN